MATSVSGDALALEENAAHIALSMEPIPGNEICEAAESCQEFFSACASSPAHEKHIASIRSAQGDFNLWCSAIKAASRGKASLDYRLRNHPDTRDAVCDLLASLKASLAKYAQSAVHRGSQDALESETAASDSLSSTGSPASWDAIFEEYGIPNSPGDDDDGLPDATSLLAEYLSYIRTTLDHLARLSLVIRKAGNKVRFEGIDAALDTNVFADFRAHLTRVILRAFPDPDAADLSFEERMDRVSDFGRLTDVQKRLVHANILRNHRIQSVTRLRGKQGPRAQEVQPGAETRGAGGAGVPRPVSLSGSTASRQTQAASISRRRKQGIDAVAPSVATTSAPTATDVGSGLELSRVLSGPASSKVTNVTRVGATLAYPRCPNLDSGGVCPYCGDVLPSSYAREENWKAHVSQDLLPYTCFVERCSTPDEMYLTSEQLLAHLIEKHSSMRWTCNFCASNHASRERSAVHPEFGSAEAWEEHIEEAHQDHFKAQQHPTRASLEHSAMSPELRSTKIWDQKVEKVHEDQIEAHQRPVLAELNKRAVMGPLCCPLCDFSAPATHSKIDDHILQHLHEFALWALPMDSDNAGKEISRASQSLGTLSHTETVAQGLGHPLVYPTVDMGTIVNILVLSSSLRQAPAFHGIPSLGEFLNWAQSVPWASRAKDEQEFWGDHLGEVRHVIEAYDEYRGGENTDVTDSMLEDIVRQTFNNLLDWKGERNPHWSYSIPNLGWTDSRIDTPRCTAGFTGRDEILDDLKLQLFPYRQSPDLSLLKQARKQPRVVLEGEAGVGKTAIAAELADRITSDRQGCAIFWVDASSAASLERSYHSIWSCPALGEPEGPLSDPIQALMYALNWKYHRQWMMILDGIHAQPLQHIVLRGWVPSGLNGRLVLTTRDASWLGLLGPTTLIQVPPLARRDSPPPLRTLLLQMLFPVPGHGEKKGFLPRRQLDDSMTEESVAAELRHCYEGPDSITIAEHSATICGTSPGQYREGQSFKKVFAILLLCDMAKAIPMFLEEGITDHDLPLHKLMNPEDNQTTCNLVRRGDSRKLECFRGWSFMEVLNFEEWQWTTIAPFFRDTPRKDVKHYVLEDQAVLPFSKDSRFPADGGSGSDLEFEGGFGQVFKVGIHPEHHDFYQPNSAEYSFAIKSLISRDRNEFVRETEALAEFSGHAHKHIVSLLATYEQSGKFNLIFPLAECNLQDFWKNYPRPSLVDREEILWIAEQCSGIADGLLRIHRHEIGYDLIEQATKSRKMLSHSTAVEPDDQHVPFPHHPAQLFGRHGDIKPENILLFRDATKDNDDKGVLKISGFGLVEFSTSSDQIDKQNNQIAFSPTYRAPECDFEGALVSRSYDIWTLGCLYLEFVTWQMGGMSLLETFSHSRLTVDPMWHQIETDTFFELVLIPHGGTETVGAMVKPVVLDFIQNLHAHPACTEYLHSFLVLIEKDMLVVESPKYPREKSRARIDQIKQKLREMLGRCHNEPGFASQPAPWEHRRVDYADGVVEIETGESFAKTLKSKNLRTHGGRVLTRDR